MELDQVRKLLSNDRYQAALSRMAEQINSRVEPDIDTPVLSIGWSTVRQSGLKEADFYRLLMEYDSAIVDYYVKGYKMFRTDIAQEYFELEEPPEEEKDEVVEELGLSVLALVMVMIEFHYLLNNDDQGLTGFFKKQRIPQLKKYQAQCRKVFEEIMSQRRDRSDI